jgi:hypothetical protein
MKDHERPDHSADQDDAGKGSVDLTGVLLGGVVGFVLSWVAPFLAAVLLRVSTREEEIRVGVSALLLVPIAALLLLLFRLLRRSGRGRAGSIGFLLGIAIGAVAGAGTCIPLWTAPS